MEMERTKTATGTDPQKVKFRKVGGGSLRIGNKIIKPGQIFEEYPENIPPAWRAYCVPQGAVSVEWKTVGKSIPTTPVVKDAVKPSYTLQLRGNSNLWWDIVDANGKVLNEKGLKKEVAEQLIMDLNKS